ncbi:pre-mRNA-processing factor 39 [Synchiropus splendidus]|uniref:pre-mRNA-processing factor 39 n=1 Tax=Synchiropus splendidus TaxID=270530 RepID=UPI00237E9603|nr:pre-mRNA-processing factor 39 [Synchiropus splendidus]
MAAEGCEEMSGNKEQEKPSAMEVTDPPDQPAAEVTEGHVGAAVSTTAQALADEGNVLPAAFERLWKAAQENHQEFSRWTDLLQYCEQEGNYAASSKALAAFLDQYPLCYGYWKKFTDLQCRAGDNKKAEEVCLKGLRAIPLSVDLWIHYINLLLGTLEMKLPESSQRIRGVFEEAVSAAGLEFRSDRLWDLYVEWEKEQGNTRNAAAVLERVLKVPTHLYNTHYTKYKAHLSSHEPKEVLHPEEYSELRMLCRQSQRAERAEQMQETQDERPPGEEEPATPEGQDTEELMKKIREQVLLRRDKVYKENEAEVRKRWNFEDAIKRPYFHVRPLDRAQLQAWRSYLDWELEQLKGPSSSNKDAPVVTEEPANDKRVRTLFERCVIACALYDEFWIRYLQYLEPRPVEEKRLVYRRACEIHLPRKANLHIQWATFEEQHGDVSEARRILAALEQRVPGLAVVRLRRAALERRAGQLDQSEALLQEAVTGSKDVPALHAFYSVKLARLLQKLGRNPGKARQVLREALEISPDNEKLHVNLLELESAEENQLSAEAVQECVTRALAASLSPHTKILLSQRGLQFAEENSSSVKRVLSIYDDHQKLLTELRGTKRAAEKVEADSEKAPKTEEAPAPDPPPVQQAASTASPAMTSDMSGYTGYSNWYQHPQYGGYGYQNTWNYNQSYYPPH